MTIRAPDGANKLIPFSIILSVLLWKLRCNFICRDINDILFLSLYDGKLIPKKERLR